MEIFIKSPLSSWMFKSKSSQVHHFKLEHHEEFREFWLFIVKNLTAINSKESEVQWFHRLLF